MTELTLILLQVLFIATLGIVFYLVLVRPQLQRLHQHRTVLASLRPGDRIATVGGLVGTIVRTDGQDFLVVDVADGVPMTITRKSVDALLDPPVQQVLDTAATEPVIA